MFSPNACPASPQNAAGLWLQQLRDIPALACPEKGALSPAQSLVLRVPQRATEEASEQPLLWEVCLIRHLLPVTFLVSGQEESESHRFRQTHG